MPTCEKCSKYCLNCAKNKETKIIECLLCDPNDNSVGPGKNL